ncbi:MAG: sugar phosphate isomerase/epimerase family protein [Caldilineaceae bacterium]
MNYAFMSFSCPQLSLADMITAAQRYGYAGLEPRTGGNHAHGVELTATAAERAAIRQQAVDGGIDLCCLAVSCRYADPATVGDQVDETRRYLDLAADLGIPRLRVFGGKIPEGISREAAVAVVAAALATVAEHAAQQQVTICLETHDDWCDPAHVVAVMQAVNHPAIAVNWDVMHPVRAGGVTMAEAYTMLRPWIRHVHIHDGSKRMDKLEFLPIGQGEFDHRQVVQLLQSDGYEGYLSGEWINWEPYDVHLPRELAAMQTYEAELAS